MTRSKCDSRVRLLLSLEDGSKAELMAPHHDRFGDLDRILDKSDSGNEKNSKKKDNDKEKEDRELLEEEILSIVSRKLCNSASELF